jgi:hypothetical protein
MIAWKRLGAVGLLATVWIVLGSACANNESSIFIRGCMVPTHDTCTVTNDPTAPELLGGALDTQPAYHHIGVSGYTCDALVGNELNPVGNPSTLQTETSRVSFYQADVTILDESGDIVTRADGSSAQYSVAVTGFADPGFGGLPGYGLAGILMIDSVTAQELAPPTGTAQAVKVVSSVVLHGRTLGGLEEKTRPFIYPITVCRGCLCEQVPGTACSGGTDKPDPNCQIGQDFAVDCRYLNASCSS